MASKLKLKGMALVCFLALFLAMANAVNTVFPKPAKQVNIDTVFSIDPRDFVIEATGKPSKILNNAISRYFAITFRSVLSEPAPFRKVTLNGNTFTHLKVNVLTEDLNLRLETDESYTLDASTAPHITLTANTVFGALRGLETFSQLVRSDTVFVG